ncbi:hypothetical protein CK203_108980 [Vitis vinifera]|uniref:Uncharacterized protein n=1 Tax=Vitis vinifera TaxID=29760 RepID=A0A438D3Z3_VITVI|nr:hypothetical protein CK203_108980 [Vitis vinifera]
MWKILVRGIPLGLVMNDMRAEGRGEHVIQPSADGADGWLVWEVPPSLLYRWVRMNVTHHGGDHGSRRRCTFCTMGVTIGSGMVPGLWPLVALVFQALGGLVLCALNLTTEIFYRVVFLLKTPADPGYIDSGSDLEFATWPLERWRALSCHSLANCLLSMVLRHSRSSSSPLPDERLREGVAIFASD